LGSGFGFLDRVVFVSISDEHRLPWMRRRRCEMRHRVIFS
jgi:hypothetical protein